MDLEIAGIPVKVIKKDIKNLHLYVKPPDGHVEVSVPQHMSDESIALFLRTRTGWIKKQQEKFSGTAPADGTGVCLRRNALHMGEAVFSPGRIQQSKKCAGFFRRQSDSLCSQREHHKAPQSSAKALSMSGIGNA